MLHLYSTGTSAYCMAGRLESSYDDYDDSSRPFYMPTAGTPRTLSVLDFPTHLVQGPRGHHQAALYGLGCLTGAYCVSARRCRDKDRRETTLDRRNQPIFTNNLYKTQ